MVWEPILRSDWRAPGRAALSRIPDPRVRQFWDPEHFIAREIARHAAAHPLPPPPACCFDNGFYWDETLLYPPGTSWASAPPPLLWSGPVYKSFAGVEAALRAK